MKKIIYSLLICLSFGLFVSCQVEASLTAEAAVEGYCKAMADGNLSRAMKYCDPAGKMYEHQSEMKNEDMGKFKEIFANFKIKNSEPVQLLPNSSDEQMLVSVECGPQTLKIIAIKQGDRWVVASPYGN